MSAASTLSAIVVAVVAAVSGFVSLRSPTRSAALPPAKGPPIFSPPVVTLPPVPVEFGGADVVSAAGWQPDQKRSAPYIDWVREAESRYAIPHNLLARLIEQESAWQWNAINIPSNAQGIAQIVPRWHPNVDPWNPQAAIDYAGGYLRTLFDQFGSWQRTLAAYNWGWGNVDGWIKAGERFAGLPTETRNYITAITGDVPV